MSGLAFRLAGAALLGLTALAGSAGPAEDAAGDSKRDSPRLETSVTPRSEDARAAFARLADRPDGVRVVTLGPQRRLLVPPALRFKPATADALVKGVADLAGLAVVWITGSGVAQQGGQSPSRCSTPPLPTSWSSV